MNVTRGVEQVEMEFISLLNLEGGVSQIMQLSSVKLSCLDQVCFVQRQEQDVLSMAVEGLFLNQSKHENHSHFAYSGGQP